MVRKSEKSCKIYYRPALHINNIISIGNRGVLMRITIIKHPFEVAEILSKAPGRLPSSLRSSNFDAEFWPNGL